MSGRVRKGRRGQSLVESTFIALVFLATLLGIFDVGQILFIHQTFVERARNAARSSVVNAYDPAVVRNLVLYNQATVPEGSTTGFMGLTAEMVNVTRADAGTNEDRLVITISSYPYRFFSPLISKMFYSRPVVVSLPIETP